MGKRSGLILTLAAVASVFAAGVGVSARSASSLLVGVVGTDQLPGGGWAFPLSTEDFGRVQKAFAAAHAVPCGATAAPVDSARSGAVGLFSRRGPGLTLALSVVADFRDVASARAFARAPVTPRVAGCLSRSLSGIANGAYVESWVVPSPLSRVLPGSRATRLGIRYAAGEEAWTGYLDLVTWRTGATSALYVFFSSAAPRGPKYEQALLKQATSALRGARTVQSHASSTGGRLCDDQTLARYRSDILAAVTSGDYDRVRQLLAALDQQCPFAEPHSSGGGGGQEM